MLMTGCDRSPAKATEWAAALRRIDGEFPDVRRISTAQLAAWQADPERTPPLLLDAREPDEFAVSHLAGARRLTPGTNPAAAMAGVARDRPIVVYGSVGYRSAEMVARLMQLGYANASNLRGGIFAWANDGRPLVDANGAVTRVHPYDRRWGRFLDPARRALAPDTRR